MTFYEHDLWKRPTQHQETRQISYARGPGNGASCAPGQDLGRSLFQNVRQSAKAQSVDRNVVPTMPTDDLCVASESVGKTLDEGGQMTNSAVRPQ
jgi:hypothetical protein